jgi:actin related protein 2/3 complex subunit 1A/1B
MNYDLTDFINKKTIEIALSPNSKDVQIYTRADPNTNAWQLTQTLTEHSSKVLNIDWAPQTNRIVTCSSDKNAYVWSFDGRVWKPELVVLRINRAATCVKWSPNGKKASFWS